MLRNRRPKVDVERLQMYDGRRTIAHGFPGRRQAAIDALRSGRFQHEARDEIDEKNLLLTGKVTPQQVVSLLKACQGTQSTCSPHHSPDIQVDVHVFKPVAKLGLNEPRRRWYIKLYFLDSDALFISVHH